MAKEQKPQEVYWEVFQNGNRVAFGPKETMPTIQECKLLRAGDCKILVEGKVYMGK